MQAAVSCPMRKKSSVVHTGKLGRGMLLYRNAVVASEIWRGVAQCLGQLPLPVRSQGLSADDAQRIHQGTIECRYADCTLLIAWVAAAKQQTNASLWNCEYYFADVAAREHKPKSFDSILDVKTMTDHRRELAVLDPLRQFLPGRLNHLRLLCQAAQP